MTEPAMTNTLDWVHLTEEIPETGLDEKRVATPEELTSLAEILGVTTCERLGVQYTIHGISDGTFRMSGRLRARVVQPCVISLEPVAQDIDEQIGIDFWPADQMPTPPKGEIDLNADDADTQPIIDGQIDVGMIAFDVLAAAVDLYPRVPGVTFEWEDKTADGAPVGKVNPFAVLAQLKDAKPKAKG
jgi:uncharacterized metal-binding protein YceD (DUF177 family)